MVPTVFAGVAEFERALVKHRTDEGQVREPRVQEASIRTAVRQ